MYEVKLMPSSAEELEKLCNEAVKHGYRLVAMNDNFCVFEKLPLDKSNDLLPLGGRSA